MLKLTKPDKMITILSLLLLLSCSKDDPPPQDEDFIPVEEESSSDVGYTTPMEYEGYRLVWHDDFDSNAVNTDFW